MLTGARLAIVPAVRRHQRDHEEEFVRGTAVGQVRVEEHEDGRILLAKETWTLIDNGAELQRVRERSNNSGVVERTSPMLSKP